MKNGYYIEEKENRKQIIKFLKSIGGIVIGDLPNPTGKVWWGFSENGSDAYEILWSNDESYWKLQGSKKIGMNKIVYNDFYGGFFDLSDEAIKWIEDHGGNIESLPRHSPLLVQCVEELGSDKVSGPYSCLKIKEISGDKYIIHEYDGIEVVLEPSDISWTQIDS